MELSTWNSWLNCVVTGEDQVQVSSKMYGLIIWFMPVKWSASMLGVRVQLRFSHIKKSDNTSIMQSLKFSYNLKKKTLVYSFK